MDKRHQGVIRGRKSMKDRQCNGQNIPRGNQKSKIKEGHTIQWTKDTKGVIRRRKSMNDRQNNGQKIPRSNQKS